MNAQEFAAKVKSKYPQYKDMDDAALTDKILTKYPQYKSQIETVIPQEAQPQTLAGKTLALTKEFSPFPTSMTEATIPMSGIRQDAVTAPLKPLLGLEKYSGQVQESASDIMADFPRDLKLSCAG